MSWNSNHQGGGGGGGWDNYQRGPGGRGGGRGGSAGGRFHGRNNRDDRNHPRNNRPYYHRRENDQRTYGHDGRLDTYASSGSASYYGNSAAAPATAERGEQGGYHRERHYHDDNHNDRRRYNYDDRNWKKTKMEDMDEHPSSGSDAATNDDRLRNVNMETWDTFTDKEHFESQYPHDFRNYESTWALIEKHNMIEFDRMLSNQWLEHKKKSADILIENYREDLRKQMENQAYDSASSDESSMFVDGARPIGAPDPSQLDPGFVKFMKALPYNVIFDVGFHMIGLHQRDEESCFCPCSKMKMMKWRRNFGIENVEKKSEKDDCSNKFYSPKALMDHLSAIGTYLHRAIRNYLEILYKEFWDYKTSHKALYAVGTPDYNRAEAALKQYFIRITELEKQRHREEMEKQRRENEEMKKRMNELEKLKVQNEELYSINVEEEEQARAAYDLFGITQVGPKLSSEQRRAQYNELRDLLDSFRTMAQSFKDESIPIILTHRMTLQDIFDSWYDRYDAYEKAKPKTDKKPKPKKEYDGGIFFYDLEPDEYYKVLQIWDVTYSDVSNLLNVPKRKGGLNKTKRDSIIKDSTAVDKGGPTREFLNTFCCQIEDLVVYLPIDNDYELKVIDEVDLYDSDSSITREGRREYMQPKCGWRVEAPCDDGKQGKVQQGKVLEYNPSTQIATIHFPEKETEMPREIFKITGIPIRLFDEDTCLPCRDHVFQVHSANYNDKPTSNEAGKSSEVSEPTLGELQREWRREGITGAELFRRISKFNAERSNNLSRRMTSDHSRIDDQLWSMISKFNKKAVRATLEEKVEQLMRLYYRAFGRLILHVIVDSDNALSSKVLPKLLRNVLLRGIQPHANEYEIKDLIDDVIDIGEVKLCTKESGGAVDKKFHDFFEGMGVDFNTFVAGCNEKSSYEYNVTPDELITKTNFKSAFASLYLIETRRKALDAIMDGLTLDTSIKIHSFFHSKDRRIIDDLLFSKASFSVEDVQELLEIQYDGEIKQEQSYIEMGVIPKHVQFLDQLKEALAELSAENESMLTNFVYFMTGMDHLPNIQARPEFRLKVGFNESSNDALPTGHTCSNEIDFPFMVYDNDFMVIKDRISTIISYARSSAFGIN